MSENDDSDEISIYDPHMAANRGKGVIKFDALYQKEEKKFDHIDIKEFVSKVKQANKDGSRQPKSL